ncbi:ATP-binding protein [Tropicimonas sp. TH_r6]|uniref:PAS domain-containing hybrid sensor histidine kinase/response regulator n=1 Tax=Tropicimonas sp. TH_r6 TaxID=3082085 RepID=UPI00295571E0|nr:ATP-binding protein [Tropicimonas sp. TH_r6]MDV7141365.1 ATP-binding protein [Tropicimonas sp. TH_r6]
MDLGTKAADKALEAFQAKRSSEGRFLSYCRGRVRSLPDRIIIIPILFPILLYVGGTTIALIGALVSISGELLDVAVLKRFGRRRSMDGQVSVAMGIATLTGGIQALANTYGVALIYTLGGSEARILAGAACFAGILDAALLLSAHRGAAIARILVYGVALLVIAIQEVGVTGHVDDALLFDLLSVSFLLYICWTVVRKVFKLQNIRNATRMDMLERAQELAHVNDALVQSRNTAKRLALVAERANDSVVITDQNGVITWINRAFSKVTGYSYTEAIGRNVSFLQGPQTDPAASEALLRAREEVSPIRLEIMCHHKDGSPIWIEANTCPLFDDTGEVLSIVSIERDIGEAKEREHALAEARRVAENSERARHNFLATMSHEIRTPMNGVIGTTDLLLETDLDNQQNALVRTIAASGESLLGIINDILDFSKLEVGRLEVAQEPFSPSDCFRSAVDLVQPLADAKEVSLDLVLPASLPQSAIGDNRRLAQVLLNLLGNAIKFTETGGVRLEVSVRLEQGNCHYLIAVRDTGMGIPPEKLDWIFESFSQADSSIAGRFGGTGLGLTISRLLVQAMGGEISVASAPGEGSVFFVSLTLPLAETSEAFPIADATLEFDQAGLLEGLTVLVAEDNRTNILLLERMLHGTGVRTKLAINGREAVEMFRLQRPDVVLMDMHMPIMDGLAATRAIREIETGTGGVATPIIALTANAFPEDRDLCMDAGMNGFVTKPFRKRDLLLALNDFIPRDSSGSKDAGRPKALHKGA